MDFPLFVNGEEVKRILKFSVIYDELEKALAIYAKHDGAYTQPLRTVMDIPKENGNFYVMPCFDNANPTLSTKIVSSFPKNQDIPKINAWLFAFSSTNGQLEAIIDGDSVTKIRTSVVSGIASMYLADPESKVLTLLGSGEQARSHFHVMCKLFPIVEVRIYSRTYSNCSLLVKELTTHLTKVKFTICTTAVEAVYGADIICSTTFGLSECLSDPSSLKSSVHINAIGACNPASREFSTEVMKQCKIYCDTYDGCYKESGDIILSESKIYAEIGEIINGSKKSDKSEITMFKSIGMALEDNVCCRLIIEGLKKMTYTSISID